MPRRLAPFALAVLLVLGLAGASCAGEEDASADDLAATQRQGEERLRLVRVGSFSTPLYATAPAGDTRRLYVVEQGGRIRVVRDGRKLARPFLDIRGRVRSGGEQGLLGLAFAPDFRSSRRFYVNFSAANGDNVISEFRARRGNPDRALVSSARRVLRIPGFESNHNSGQLAFGPDGFLYIGTGDGGGGGDQHGARGNAQDLGSLNGKVLRIDPRRNGRSPYRSPRANAFADRPGARREIYAYGLRNPWRFSFDRRTGDLAIGDVGQNAVEEVSFVRRGRGNGANFGWRPFEGRSRFRDEPAPGHVPPVVTLGHSGGVCSITGGYVVRDPRVPALAGRYVFGDLCEGRIRVARLRAGRRVSSRVLAGLPSLGLLASFGEDGRGRVHVISIDRGLVFRIAQG